MKLRRRMTDAVYAFCTGHSKRDFDRARRRRFRFLADRVVQRARAEAALSSLPRHARMQTDLADAVQDLSHRAVVGRERVAETRLLQQFDIDRGRLHGRRRDQLVQWCLLDCIPDLASRSLEPFSVASVKLYGKLYEGLSEQRLLDFFLDRARFRIRYRHWDLHRQARQNIANSRSYRSLAALLEDQPT